MAENGTTQRLRVPLFSEIGTTGLRQWGGRLDEEWLRALRSQTHRYAIYREMAENDAIIGAGLRVIEMLVRQVTWEIEPASEENAAQEAAEWLRGALFADMSSTWQDVVAESLSMLVYGFAFHEIIYKRRGGERDTPGEGSQYTDGQIGWRKFPIRAQETLDSWRFDETGGVQAMVQQPPLGGPLLAIPIEKALLFRTAHHKGSPEGRSILRTAWRAWAHKKRIEELQGIGIERDLAGLPMATVPARIMAPDATPEEMAVYAEMQRIVTRVRNDEQGGVVMPSDRDEHGHPYYEFKLLSAAGQGRYDTTVVIEQKNKEMMLSMLTDVLLIGHEKVGSYSLGDSKTTLLSVALGVLLDEQETVMNRHAIPRLHRLNGRPRETQGRLKHGDIEAVNLEELANFILHLAQAGFDMTGLEIENEVRRRARFPLKTEEDEVPERRRPVRAGVADKETEEDEDGES